MTNPRRKGYESANLLQYQIEKRKPVANDLGEIFESVTEAAKIIGCHTSGIFGCIKGRPKTYKRRQWFYLEFLT